MSLISRNLLLQMNCTVGLSSKFHFQCRKFSFLSSPRPCLKPLNFNAKKSHFLSFGEDTSHGHHWPIWVKPLEQNGMVGKGNFVANEFKFNAFLSILEFLALASSAVISVIFAVNSGISGSLKPVFVNRFLVLQCVCLLVGVVLGAFIRRRQWRRICSADSSRPTNLVERIEKLEEELRSSAKIIQVLSRQLEKLGIRFRLTRKALKEPIAETTALAQKNSEATRALAAQEDVLEKELVEIQKVLLAMQEQQQKQLELILAIGKGGKLWETKQEQNHEENSADTANPPADQTLQLGPNQIQALASQKEGFGNT